MSVENIANDTILEIKNLTVHYVTEDETVEAVNDLSLKVNRGKALGLGVTPPMPEWGNLLSAGRTYIKDYSYLTMFPGLVIMLTVIAFNMLGDGLRDAMDPKLKK